MLFTDAANPTSNAIYQAIGYRLVDEFVQMRFAERAERYFPVLMTLGSLVQASCSASVTGLASSGSRTAMESRTS